MVFHFKLEVLRKHLKHLEDQARRDLIEAQGTLDECLRKINDYYQSIEDTREAIAQAQGQGETRSLEEVRIGEEFIIGQNVRIKNERLRARELMAKVEERREKAVEAAREYKKIDKLKERQLRLHKKEKRRIEAKEVDDIVVMRAGRGPGK